jgi:prephenate dehydratase
VPDRHPAPDPAAAAHALAEVRARIDDTDRRLLRLLDQRIELAVRAGRLKTAVTDAAREAQVLEKVRSAAYGLLSAEFVTGLYGAIMAEGKRLQEARPGLAGFQGERGAWSEVACLAWDEALVPVPCRGFADVFDGVARGTFDRGVVPVENSLGGAVVEVSDLLIARDLSVVGEVVVPVRQCLLALPGVRLRDVRTVYSHPQALAQCRAFLEEHDLEGGPFYDTAGAARWLMFEGSRTSAAIASPLAASLYGLEVLADAIADEPGNETRFLVISRTPAEAGGDKCSIVLTTEDRSGALAESLGVFAAHGLNLSRIESRPTRVRPGTYAFVIDFLGGADAPAVDAALAALAAQCPSLKVLGFYAAARR